MTAEVVSKYTWNVADYCHIKYGDGTHIELKSTVGRYTTDQEWIDLALQLYALRPVEPDPLTQLLLSVSDAELVAEVLRRHITITVEGSPV